MNPPPDRPTANSSLSSLPALLRFIPGLTVCGILALLSMAIGRIDWLTSHGFGTLTLAIVLGLLLGNTIYPRFAPICGAGVALSRQTLLRLGIVLYGLRLTAQDLAHIGAAGMITSILMVGTTFALALVLARRLGLDRQTAMLIGAGSSICGAAAVMATAPVAKAQTEQTTVAIATVVVFGTLAIFLYPALYELNRHWHFILNDTKGFGIYIGSTVHEVAQVVVTARAVGPEAADVAIITKMARVILLGPFLMGLSIWLARDETCRHDTSKQRNVRAAGLAIPWFAFAFTGVVLFNSLHWLPEHIIGMAAQIDTVLLAMAMGALGLTTHLDAIHKAGIRPLLLALMLFVWLIVGGAFINFAVAAGLAP